MPSLTLSISISSYWHAGSGLAGSGDLDATIVRDPLGLPYLPGKTLKGLFRNAATLFHSWNNLSPLSLKQIFGSEGGADPTPASPLHFSDARFPAPFLQWTKALPKKHHPLLSGLTATLSSTAIEENGIAKDKSLRKIEFALPADLSATVSWENDSSAPAPNPPPDFAAYLAQLAPLIRCLGSHRHRGFGDCRISLSQPS